MKPAAAPFLVVAALATIATGQQPFELQPGTQFDAAVPTLQAITGYALGEEVSLHGEVERYLQALVKAAPERTRLVEYGRTWQGRALYYLVLGSAANMQRLEAIQAGMQKLADPRRLQTGEAERLVADLPAVAWFAYCVHGDEASGTDACLQVAYHLLASKDDAVVRTVLANCVVILDPLQNPDGRDRFVHSTRAGRGRWADADPESAEHTQAWPGGRFNHYLFDMNRDWFGLSQPETRGRVRAFQQWWPLCYVDLHEMGGDSTYYFSPPSPPLNPEITATQRDWLFRYGRNNAGWFDRFGFDYFTREEFDSFYPGYGEGWPTFHGSIGMTFEQASARGIVFRRRDESLLHYRECVRHHFVATLGTLETLANGRKDALAAFLAYRQSAIDEGRAGPEREYLFPDRGDRTRLARLMNLLCEQGIEVQRATAELRCSKAKPYLGGEAKEQTFPTGSYVVSLAQPGKRLATVLLHRQFEMDSKWLEQQRQREKKRLEPEFYDLTAWSLPLLFDVETWIAEDASAGPRQTLAPGAASPVVAAVPAAPPKVGWVVPWGSNGAAALLAELLQASVHVRSLDKPFRLGGQDFPAGSFVVKVAGNPPNVRDLVANGAARSGVAVLATDSSWVESGSHFGSNNAHVPKQPRVALAWDRPTNASSAGWVRFLLEQRYGVPVTPVRTQHLGEVELDRYTVLVLPDGNGYGAVIGKGGADKIKHWVERGGVLVTLGSATRWLVEDGVGLLASKTEDRKPPKKPKDDKADAGKPGDKAATDKAATDKVVGDKPAVAPGDAAPKDEAKKDKKDDDDEPFDYDKAIQPDKEAPPRTPGALLRVQLDPEHWLAFGYDGHANVVADSRDIFTPVKLDAGTNVGTFAAADQLVLSGFLWEPTRKLLPHKAYLVHQPHGKGHVVAFAEDPNLRAFADGLNLLFLNAVLLGAGR